MSNMTERQRVAYENPITEAEMAADPKYFFLVAKDPRFSLWGCLTVNR